MTLLRPTRFAPPSPHATGRARTDNAPGPDRPMAEGRAVFAFGPPAASPRRLHGASVRAMSPRQMAALGWDLYVAGLLDEEAYVLLAFQPEFHPHFERTIGALTGGKAQPDEPKDYLRLWEERLQFERAHGGARPKISARIGQILRVLRAIEELSSRRRVA